MPQHPGSPFCSLRLAVAAFEKRGNHAMPRSMSDNMHDRRNCCCMKAASPLTEPLRAIQRSPAAAAAASSSFRRALDRRTASSRVLISSARRWG